MILAYEIAVPNNLNLEKTPTFQIIKTDFVIFIYLVICWNPIRYDDRRTRVILSLRVRIPTLSILSKIFIF